MNKNVKCVYENENENEKTHKMVEQNYKYIKRNKNRYTYYIETKPFLLACTYTQIHLKDLHVAETTTNNIFSTYESKWCCTNQTNRIIIHIFYYRVCSTQAILLPGRWFIETFSFRVFQFLCFIIIIIIIIILFILPFILLLYLWCAFIYLTFIFFRFSPR